MANQLTGRIEVLGATKQVASKSGSTFSRRELVLNCARYDQYTGEKISENHPQFEFSGKACEKLDGLNVGDVIVVLFTLQGSWYEKDGIRKNFTRVVGYDVEVKTREASAPQSPAIDNIPPVPPIDRLPWE